MKLTKGEVKLIRFFRRIKRIRWDNILALLIGVALIIFILKDLGCLVFKGGCFTWFGLGTHILAWFGLDLVLDKLFNINEL